MVLSLCTSVYVYSTCFFFFVTHLNPPFFSLYTNCVLIFVRFFFFWLLFSLDLSGRTTYPDASMLIFVTQLEFDHDEDDHDDAGDDGDEVGHQHTAAEHAEILTAAEVEATAMFSSTSAQNKLNGDVIRPAAVMQRIVFDNDDAVTTLTIRIDEAG